MVASHDRDPDFARIAPGRTDFRSSRRTSSRRSCCVPGSCATAACSSAASSLASMRPASPSRSSARSPSATATTPGRRFDPGYYAEFDPDPTYGSRPRTPLDQERRRRAGRRLADAQLRDARDVRRARPARSSSRDYLGEPPLITVAQDDAAQGATRPSPGPGTRTASSWARSTRSTCGCRCRTAATRPPASTSSRAASTTT